MLTIGGKTPAMQTVRPPGGNLGGDWYGTTSPYAKTPDVYGTGQFPHGGGPGAGVELPETTPVVPTVVTGTYGTGDIGDQSNVDWTSMIGGSYEVAQAEAMMAQQMARAR